MSARCQIQYFSNPHLTVVKYFILRFIPYTIAGEVWAVSVVCSQRPVSHGSVWWKSESARMPLTNSNDYLS